MGYQVSQFDLQHEMKKKIQFLWRIQVKLLAGKLFWAFEEFKLALTLSLSKAVVHRRPIVWLPPNNFNN